MKQTIGFPISHKENEYRRAIIPEHVARVSDPYMLFFEQGYGDVCGYSDADYAKLGANIVSHDDVLKQNVICDPKVGDADYLERLHKQTIFGWIHATQNRDITDKLIKSQLTAFAWEKMFYKGRHVFWQNNELAGEAAVLHAFQCYGELPYNKKVAVIGRGNTARGAIRALNMLGAKVMQYDRRTESLLSEEIGEYDVIVNCVLWDVTRNDHIIYKGDLKRMKNGAMIIDVSCDRNGGVETSIPTTIENPTYQIDGILHYVVDHTPSIFFKTFTEDNSAVIWPYLNELISKDFNQTMKDCLIIEYGKIIDREINKFQHR